MPAPSNLRRELTLLVLSRYSLVVLEGSEEARVEELVARVAADLTIPLLVWSSSTGLVRPSGGGLDGTEEPEEALARVAAMETEVIALFHDLHPYLERPAVVRRLREIDRRFGGGRSTAVLAGVAVELPASLAHRAARLELALPGEAELERLVRATAAELAAQRRIRVDLAPSEVTALARALSGLERDEARRLLHQAALRDGALSLGDLEHLLAGKRRRVEAGGLLQWVEPLTGFGAVGGAENLAAWVRRRREAFGEAARRFGLDPPKGLLLTGVPGTGKSLACRALAGEWKLPLLGLDPGRLFDRFVGETEANLRRALATAEAMAPAVLWIDEIEKGVSAEPSQSDAGLSRRVAGALLTWMQERPAPVFLVATANDVEALPVELLRRGRFDEVFFFDLPGAADRERIFALHLERRERKPEGFDLAALAAATEGFSGAEIEGVVVAALYHAFGERQPLATDVLAAEAAATRPLSRLRPEAITTLRAWGRTHARPA
jgi:AAA+ superfamily predicted ATPase